jgi:hypothetical protein
MTYSVILKSFLLTQPVPPNELPQPHKADEDSPLL